MGCREEQQSCNGPGGHAAPRFCVLMSLKIQVPEAHGRVARPNPKSVFFFDSLADFVELSHYSKTYSKYIVYHLERI